MTYPIKPEQLKHIISIQEKTGQGTDSDGYPIEIWSDVAANIHSYVDPTGGNEFYAAQKVNAEANFNVWIRYRTGITSFMRVKYGTRTFDIISPPIDLYEAHRWIRLICKELI